MSKVKRARTCYNLRELTEKIDPKNPHPTIPNFNDLSPKNSLLAMPNEIKQMIYSYLPQKDALNHRLVCKDAKVEIDSLYHFSVNYDDQKRRKLLKKIQTWRIEEIDVINFRRKLTSTPALKYPQLIQTLHIGINKQISPENFRYVMSECSSHLKTLVFKISEDLPDSYSGCLPLQYNFRDLKTLIICTKKVRPSLGPKGRDSVNNMLSSISKNCQVSPCGLTTIDIRLGLNSADDLLSKETSIEMCSMISKKHSTLKNLRVHLEHTELGMPALPNLYPEDEFAELGITLWDKFDSLKEVDFNIVGCEKNDMSQLCKLLLLKQRHLEDLTFTACSNLDRNFFGIHDVILNNCATLTSISLAVYYEAESCLDFSIFKNCSNLKTLKLNKTPECNVHVFSDITNLNLLPSSLEHLEVSLFIINPTQMENFIAREDLQCLKVLVLNYCNVFQEFGEDCSVLKSILNLPNILEIRIKGVGMSKRWENFVKIATSVGISFPKLNCLGPQEYFNILWGRKSITRKWTKLVQE